MARILVDGYERVSFGGLFEDTDPVAVVPTVPDSVLRMPAVDGMQDGVANGHAIVSNNDSVTHNWRAFLRGTGVPGGEIEIGTPTRPAPQNYFLSLTTLDSTGLPYWSRPLMPGQRIDLELVQGVTTTPPAWQAVYKDILIQDLKVSGRVPGNQIDLVTATSPSILSGPPAGARYRRVRQDGFVSLGGAMFNSFFNRDYNAAPPNGDHNISVTLLDPVNGDRLLAPTNGCLSGSFFYPPFAEVLLEPGQSLKLTLLEAVQTTAPFMFWFYEDIL